MEPVAHVSMGSSRLMDGSWARLWWFYSNNTSIIYVEP